MDIDITAEGDLAAAQLEDLRARLMTLERYVGEDAEPLALRLTLRDRPGHGDRRERFEADASLPFDGRVLAAHTTGPTPTEAIDAVVQRLRRQLRRVVDADVALRNEPRTIAKAVADLARERPAPPAKRLKPPEERAIVSRRTYAPGPEPTLSAVVDLLEDAEQFHLFVHVRTNEDVVVHWRDDDRLGLLFPPGSALADEDDIVVAMPSRYGEPLSLAVARSEMDVLNHRFLYYLDAADGRGRVLYLRTDGDYGLVEPE
ncbi:MAG TPA: sigma 54 modulation/S30EA ribosomal C-terminal domain-containing protein [Baekduia sp.]|jgi:ribosome-associated translation inhibitor RaiA